VPQQQPVDAGRPGAVSCVVEQIETGGSQQLSSTPHGAVYVGFAEANVKMLASLRGKGGGMSKQQREHAYEVSNMMNQNPILKARFFFLESDLKDGTSVKRDKTSKCLLQLLRHLRRFTEVCTIASMAF
jgi:Spindle and kinetochore-associated protein 1